MSSLTLPLLPLLLAGLGALTAAAQLGRLHQRSQRSAERSAEQVRAWQERGDEVRRLCAQPTLRAPVLTRPVLRSAVQAATSWRLAA